MNIQTGIIYIFALLFAITVHESAHAWAAFKLGDPTAYSLGRVTLNPIPHIDLMGTILLPLIMIIMGGPPFGWAKPVPVNPLNLRNPKRDNLIISAAGPLSNIALAIVCIILLKILYLILPSSLPQSSPALPVIRAVFTIIHALIMINVILAVFNMIPIPPLDGSGVLMGFLSPEASRKYEQLQPYGFFIIIILLMTGIIGRILGLIMGLVNLLI
jgi:Zn-dependent protease